MIPLKDLLRGVVYTEDRAIETLTVERIEADSRRVAKGDVFVAIEGAEADGHRFIAQAVERGASAVVLQKDRASIPVPKIKVENTREALARMAANYYNDPSKDIKVVGVTGTNGKTTVTYIIESILRAAGLASGIMGTVRYKVGQHIIEADNTTPSPVLIQQLLREMADKALDYCVMEASSHALDQERTKYIGFSGAIFTNATPEHLDYHKDFDHYLGSKLKLFKMLKREGIAAINRDDPNFSKVRDSSTCTRRLSYGTTNSADMWADGIELGLDGSRFVLRYRDVSIPVVSRLLGMHNIYNMMAAALWALEEGIRPEAVRSGLEALSGVPGRLEPVPGWGAIKVFVDYAHTDDALEKTLLTLSVHKARKIITVFGCGGNRDKTKRARMGRVAARLSDYFVITSDNPRFEDPNNIIRDVLEGVGRREGRCGIFPDRRDAIENALSVAQDGDIVLIAGKGHEKYQIIRDEKIPFDDREVAKEFLEAKCST